MRHVCSLNRECFSALYKLTTFTHCDWPHSHTEQTVLVHSTNWPHSHTATDLIHTLWLTSFTHWTETALLHSTNWPHSHTVTDLILHQTALDGRPRGVWVVSGCGGWAKVTQLQHSLVTQQQVLHLKVAVDDGWFLFMHVLHSATCLVEYSQHQVWWHGGGQRVEHIH